MSALRFKVEFLQISRKVPLCQFQAKAPRLKVPWRESSLEEKTNQCIRLGAHPAGYQQKFWRSLMASHERYVFFPTRCFFATRAPDLNCQYYQIIVQREGVLCHCQIPGLYRTPKSYDYLIFCPLPTYFYIPIHNPGKLKIPVKTKGTKITIKKRRISYLIHQFIAYT